ncbi:MAG: hypothetical protein V1779_09390 [bacterium]
MIEEFIESVIIIDDKQDEINNLSKLLEEKEILVKYYNPDVLRKIKNPLKNRRIIFLDLYIDDKIQNTTGQISEIRKILKNIIGKNYSAYGIVLWTQHLSDIEELKSKIKLDFKEYTLPIFIIGLDKIKYIKNGYSELFIDLNSELEKNIAAKFFINWSNLVSLGKDKAITNIYSLVHDYCNQEANLQYILYQMALNYTGIPIEDSINYPIHIDAFKAFNEMMNYEIIANSDRNQKLFDKSGNISFDEKNKEKLKIYSQINSKLLIDENVSGDVVIPGNVYQIKLKKSEFKIADIPNGAIPIVIETTPPCDFAYPKRKGKHSRAIGGFISEFSESDNDKYKGHYYYNEIWPLFYKDKNKIKRIVFDFRYFGFLDTESDLKKPRRYKLLFRVKDKLFADILQKLSSHTARLGLAILH